jgi:hypothetical protein
LSQAQFLYIKANRHYYMSKKKSKYPKNKSDKREHGSREEEEKAKQREPDNGDYGRPGEERETGGEREIFVEMVQRRLGGGATPTPEAYARAMDQWQKMPGAVQSVPVADLARIQEDPVPPEGNSATSSRAKELNDHEQS